MKTFILYYWDFSVFTISSDYCLVVWCPTDSFEGLGDDEDVVNTNPEEYEGDDGVSGGVEETEHRAKAVTKDHTHGNTRHGYIIMV